MKYILRLLFVILYIFTLYVSCFLFLILANIILLVWHLDFKHFINMPEDIHGPYFIECEIKENKKMETFYKNPKDFILNKKTTICSKI